MPSSYTDRRFVAERRRVILKIPNKAGCHLGSCKPGTQEEGHRGPSSPFRGADARTTTGFLEAFVLVPFFVFSLSATFLDEWFVGWLRSRESVVVLLPHLFWIRPSYRSLSSFQRLFERSVGRNIFKLTVSGLSVQMHLQVTAAGEP